MRVRTVITGAMGLALLLTLWLPGLVVADQIDVDVSRVANQLQCPVCEGQTVAASNSGLAADMRAVIRTKLRAGESDQQILDEFVASYGDSILSDPPKRGLGLGVWVGPVVGLAVGALIVVSLLVAWVRRRPPAPVGGAATEVDPSVAEELQHFREEYGV